MYLFYRDVNAAVLWHVTLMMCTVLFTVQVEQTIFFEISPIQWNFHLVLPHRMSCLFSFPV
jgi:hypothetical protein